MTGPQDADLALLLDEARIARLVSRYASMVDWLDWPGMATLFTPDARFDFGPMFQGGLDGYIPFASALEEGYDRRLHLFGMPRIDVRGDRARAECPSWIHARTKGAEVHTDAVFAGRYVFDARRTDAGWKLSRLAYYLGVLDVTHPPAADEAPTNPGDGWGPGHAEAPPVQTIGLSPDQQ